MYVYLFIYVRCIIIFVDAIVVNIISHVQNTREKNNNLFVAFAEGNISELSILFPNECKYRY